MKKTFVIDSVQTKSVQYIEIFDHTETKQVIPVINLRKEGESQLVINLPMFLSNGEVGGAFNYEAVKEIYSEMGYKTVPESAYPTKEEFEDALHSTPNKTEFVSSLKQLIKTQKGKQIPFYKNLLKML